MQRVRGKGANIDAELKGILDLESEERSEAASERGWAGLRRPVVRPALIVGLRDRSRDPAERLVEVDLQISIRWPASVPNVADAVRDTPTRHHPNSELTGLNVTEVSISVTDLVATLAPHRGS